MLRAYFSQQRLHFKNRKSILIRLTNGFGNNMFQTMAGRLLAHIHNRQVLFRCEPDYYGLKELRKLGIDYPLGHPSKTAYEINESNFLQHLKGAPLPNECILRGYFEDYRFFIDHMGILKSWLPKTHESFEGLTIHFRTGDRLFYKKEWPHKTTSSQWRSVIRDMNSEQIRIVTDFPIWKEISETELKEMRFHVNVPENERVNPIESCEYINEMISMFNEFNPISILHQSISEDFNSIRSSDKILFEHGTLSWWAAFLSNASDVRVYGPWRSWKPDGYRNLSSVPLEAWKKWGEI